LDQPNEPQFPFGYGLSYADFQYGKPKIQLKNDTLYLEFKVENSSKVSGKETVQVYFSDEIASMTRPVKQLIRFEKRLIPAENSERFNFSIPVKDFGYYDENGVWKWEAGSYRIHVGPNSENTQMIAFECK
jgi:beta-glucosidase